MSNAAHDVAAHLAAQSVGALGSTIFYGTLPPTPDTGLVVRNGASAPSDYIVSRSSGPTLERRGVQVWARGSTEDAAHDLAYAAYDALKGLRGGASMNGSAYGSVTVDQVPFGVGRDELGRYEYALNVTLTLTP